MDFAKESVITKHIYRSPHWLHLISSVPVSPEIENALLHAQGVLRAQYGVYSHKCIQPSIFTGDELLETEAGVGIISWHDIVKVPPDEIGEVYLVSDDLFNEFLKFHTNPEDYKEFDDLLKVFWDKWGLVYALCNPDKVVMIDMNYGHSTA